jgi:hypothetical protein
MHEHMQAPTGATTDKSQEGGQPAPALKAVVQLTLPADVATAIGLFLTHGIMAFGLGLPLAIGTPEKQREQRDRARLGNLELLRVVALARSAQPSDKLTPEQNAERAGMLQDIAGAAGDLRAAGTDTGLADAFLARHVLREIGLPVPPA